MATGCSSDIGRADGTYHTFWYEDVNQPMREASNFARNEDLDPTRIDTHMVSQSGEYVDVVVHQDNYVTGDCGFRWHLTVILTA